MRYYVTLGFHLFLIIIAYLSPFILDWRLILAIVIFLNFQDRFYGNCVLTVAQFKNHEESFYHHYLKKVGFNFPKKNVDFVVTHILPWTIFIIALVKQVVIPYLSK